MMPNAGSRGRVVRVVVLLVVLALAAMPGCGRAKRVETRRDPRTTERFSTSTAGSGDATSLTSAPPLPAPAAPLPTPAVTAPVARGKVQPPAEGALIGVFRPPAPFQMSRLDGYANVSDKRPAILMWYQPWGEEGMHEFDAAACVSAYQRGMIPMITWEPWQPGKTAHSLKNPANQPAFRLRTIAGGKYDSYIRSWAREMKDLRGPVMLRFGHEMNGTWYPWSVAANGNSPQDYVAAWRHVHDIFEDEGATNVTWVWSINRENVGGMSYADSYPGDEYVDWTGISGFNFGGSRWMAWDDSYREVLAYLRTVGKPIVIAEMACVEKGGAKHTWIADAYERIRLEHPEVKAVVYYDSAENDPKGTQDFQIESSASAVKAYRHAVSFPYYIGGPAPTLDEWTRGLTDSDWRRLKSYRPVY